MPFSSLFLNLILQLERLKDENQRLRIECDLMTREVDLYDNGTGK